MTTPADDPEAEPAPPGEKVMGFLDHLEELRWTLVKCAIVYGVFVALLGFFLKDAAALLRWPLDRVAVDFPALKAGLITNSPMAVFTVIIQVCLLGGLVLSLPLMLVFVGQFVAPALTTAERRLLVPGAFGAMLLFAGGAVFSYLLVVPSAIKVAMELNQALGFELLWSADRYYSLLVWLVLGMGLIFEFPLLILLAVHLGFVDVPKLRRSRRLMIVVFFVAAAIITPTPDPLTQCLVALPMLVLYELSIVLAVFVARRRERSLAEA